MQARNRRVCMLQALAAGTALAVPPAVLAQAAASGPVKETDAYPKSMGFRINTANVVPQLQAEKAA